MSAARSEHGEAERRGSEGRQYEDDEPRVSHGERIHLRAARPHAGPSAETPMPELPISRRTLRLSGLGDRRAVAGRPPAEPVSPAHAQPALGGGADDTVRGGLGSANALRRGGRCSRLGRAALSGHSPDDRRPLLHWKPAVQGVVPGGVTKALAGRRGTLAVFESLGHAALTEAAGSKRPAPPSIWCAARRLWRHWTQVVSMCSPFLLRSSPPRCARENRTLKPRTYRPASAGAASATRTRRDPSSRAAFLPSSSPRA